jgi:Secretion system C-terminal sorting domain
MNQKFTKNLAKRFLLVLTLLVSILSVNAQLIRYPSSAAAITRGLDSTTLTVRIDFPAGCTNPLVTVNLGATNTPGIVQYIPGSLAVVNGTGLAITSPGYTITQSNISNLSSPVFAVSPNPTAGTFITFTIKRRANCGTAGATKDVVIVAGGCNFTEADASVNTYNLLAPALTIVPSAALINVNVGATYNRTISVTNGGNGCLDTLGFWVTYPTAGSLQLNSLRIGATTLTPVFQNADSAYYKVTGTFFGADNLLCNGETVVFTENITVLKCNATTNYGAAWYEHISTTACQAPTTTVGIIMSSELPSLSASMALLPAVYLNYCLKADEQKTQIIKIKNTGAGTATNIDVIFTAGGSVYFDTTLVWNVRNNAGTIIGTVSNFRDPYSGIPFYNASCVVNNAIQASYRGTLSASAIIPGNDSITIEIPTKVTNLTCPANNCAQTNGFNISAALFYKSQCATSNFIFPATYIAPGGGSTGFGTTAITAPLNVNGFIPNNTFTLDLNYSYYNYNNLDGTGITYLAIPLAGTSMKPNGTATLGVPSYPMTFVNDTLFIQLQQFAYQLGYFMSIPLIADCGFLPPIGSGGGEKTLDILGFNKYAGCGDFQKIYCGSKKVVIHCPSGPGTCPTGGATPVSFSFNRISLGLPDNNSDNIPDPTGSLNMALIKVDRSVNGDTLQGKWNIVIRPNVAVSDPNFGANIPYVYIDADIRGAGADPLAVGYLTALPNAQVTIYPAGGGAAINCTVSPTILLAGSFAHYEMGTACRGGFWQANDSIVVKANYTINAYNGYKTFGSVPVNQAGSYEFKTKNEVYSAYTQKLTQQTAPIAGQTYTCDHYDEINTVSFISFGGGISGSLDGCSGLFSGQSGQSIRNSEASGVFPYEYRNFYVPKKYRVTVMPGAKIVPTSAYFIDAGNPISPANITQIGDTVEFNNLQIFYTPYGGSIVPPNGGTNAIQVYYKVKADCATTTGLYYGDMVVTGAGNGVNTPALPTPWVSNVSASAYAYDYKAPQPVISSNGTVFSTDGTASWNVVVQNQSNTTAADFSWFYITPNGLTNIVVKEGATVITPVSSVYQLGSLAAASSRTFTVTGKINSCSKDSMIVNYGTTCDVYPTAAEIISSRNCNRSTTLILDNYPSQIQLIVAKQPVLPGNTVPLCTVNTAEFVINSALGGFVDNPQFLVAPPTGAIITGAQIEYPLGSGNLQTIAPFTTTPFYTYRVEDHPALTAAWGTRGLPGTIENPLPAGRQAKLIVSFTTDCNFTSGSRLQVRQQGSRPCGTLIPTALGYNNIIRTEPISILGAGGTGSFPILTTLTPTIVGCNTATVGGSLIPLLVNSTASDTVVINLPEGIIYQTGSFTTTSGLTIVAGYPQVLAGIGTIIKLKVPAAVAVGVNLTYQFNIKTTATSGCGNFAILQEVERSFAPLLCNGIACPNASKAIIGSDVKGLVIDKFTLGGLSLTNLTPGGLNLSAGQTASLRLSLKNESATLVIPANSLQVQFYCGSNASFGSPIGTPKVFNSAAIATGAAAFADFSVFLPSPACANNVGQCVWAVITPSASNCTCDEVATSICPLLPIDFENFTAKPVSNFAQLNWKVSNDFTAKHYEVEHSIDGRTYKKLATIPSTNAGAYSYLHTTPSVNNFYRIKALDIYGVTNYSVYRQVNFSKGSDGITVYPNPSEGTNKVANVKFPLSLYHKAAQVLIYAADGKMVLNTNIKSLEQVEQFNIANLANGVYNIIVKSESDTYNTKLIVSK